MRKKTRKKLILFLSAIILLSAIAAGAYFWGGFNPKPTVTVYFFKGAHMAPVVRPIGADEAPLDKAMEALIKGPDLKESGQGIISEIPGGIKILGLRAQQDLAIVNFNDKLEFYGGGAARIQGIIAQIVYTATAVKGINKVWIWVNGKKQVVLGGEGLVLDHPLSRRDIRY